jgi:hypothetical protein
MSYVGCYADASDRDLPYLAGSGASMSVETCRSLCAAAGHPYAGVQFGRECFCGASYGRHGVATNCDTPCEGNPAETCGGFWANSIYATTPYVPPVTVEPEPTTTQTTQTATTQQPTQQPQEGMSKTTIWLIVGGVLLLAMGGGGKSR